MSKDSGHQDLLAGCLVVSVLLLLNACAPAAPGTVQRAGFGNPFKSVPSGEESLNQTQQSRQNLNRQMVLADKYYASGQYAEAYTTYKDIAALDSDNPLVQYRLGNLAFRQKNHAAAMGYFEKTLSLTPDNPKAHYNMAITLLELAKQHLTDFKAAAPEGQPAQKIERLLGDLDQFYSQKGAAANTAQPVSIPAASSEKKQLSPSPEPKKVKPSSPKPSESLDKLAEELGF